MKKEYSKPSLKENEVLLSDIIAVSQGGGYDDGEKWGELHS